MDKRTETALRASIAHWEGVVRDPVNADIGPKACALCQMSSWTATGNIETRCNGCPVKAHTGMNGCHDTPYSVFEDAYDAGEDELELRRLATLELEFLKSLLPK